MLEAYVKSLNSIRHLSRVSKGRSLVSGETHTGGFSLDHVSNRIVAMGTYAFPPLEQSRVDLSEQLQQSSSSSCNSLVFTLAIFDQVAQKLLLHTPRLPAADLANSVDTGSNDFSSNTRVHEFLGELADDGRKYIGRCQLVNRLRKRDKDQRHTDLMVGEVFDDVTVETKNTELVETHDSREELHDENLVLERVLLVCGR